MSAFQTRLASEYSSLFSSGLLAPPRTSFDHDRTPTSSPAASPFSSPMKVGPDADSNALDVGDRAVARAAVDRATTPTPGSYRPLAPPSPSTPASHHAYNRKQENLPPSSRHPQTPSMRRRKSSLSLAASPLPMLKSRPSLVLRARSGSYSSVSSGGSSHGNGHLSMSSLSAGPMTAMPAFMRSGSDGTVGTTNLMGRMRSGSLGGAIRAGARRIVRKPSKAPPSMPLPPTPATTDGVPPMPGLPSFDIALASPLTATPTMAYSNPFGPPNGAVLRRPLVRRAQTNVDSIPEHEGGIGGVDGGVWSTDKLARALREDDGVMQEN